MDDLQTRQLCYQIIGAAYEVRKNLGRFLYENIYEEAMHIELGMRGIKSSRQVYIPVFYKGHKLKDPYKLDLLVEDKIPIELKTLNTMGSTEFSQIMSYMVFGNFHLRYLMNFKAVDFCVSTVPDDMELFKGIYRIVN